LTEPELDPQAVLEAFRRHDVRFVVIGGFAAVIHGSPYVTGDIDIVPQATVENLDRLSDALDELHARVWTAGVPEGIAFGQDAKSLSETNVWNLITDSGRLDLTFVPSGTSGYQDLSRDATRIAILGVDVDVASLADVIRSKEAAGRDKDRLVLPVLRQMLDHARDRSER
jgi:predicted nucleotidyltransferase